MRTVRPFAGGVRLAVAERAYAKRSVRIWGLVKDILVINCGSSSLKFAVIRVDEGRTLLSGMADRLGSTNASLRWGAHATYSIPASAGPEEVLAEIESSL